MKRIFFAIGICLTLVHPARSAVFTSDASIGFDNTNYEGQDIVVIGCTLTIDGPHAFSDVLVIDNGLLTHSSSSNGLLANPLHIAGELQTLSGTNFATLTNLNVVAGSIVVMGIGNNVTYTNGSDYVLGDGGDGTTEIARLPGSTIPDGATVSVSYQAQGQAVSAGLNLTVADNVVIEAGSGIVADGDGFGPGLGGGAGASLNSDYPFGPPFYYRSGGGGGYGGYGGASFGEATGGNSYGSATAPNSLGSGGGAGVGSGGAGGGSIKLVVGGVLVADGWISANGSGGVNAGSGGGSGGSVWLSAQTFSGAGWISANGGAGEPYLGGGGGGGRVAVICGTNDFVGTLTAHGGAGATPGGAGTVFTQAAGNTNGRLVADNGGLSGTNTPLALPSGADLTISGGAIAGFPGSVPTIGNLLIASNSWLLASSSSTLLTVASNATLQPGGGISADGKGSVNPGLGGGGGYGGNGGAGSSSVDTSAFGSITQPTNPGHGGGATLGVPILLSHGGPGGGAIQLHVAGALALGGSISANGAFGFGQGASGGSGGGILVNSAAISGGGTISANGGAAYDSSGGGGGGGRIAVYSGASQFTGRMFATGGAGGAYGGAGTIFSQFPSNSVAQVLLDNGGRPGATTPLSTISDGNNDLTVSNGAVASLGGTAFSARNLVVSANGFIVLPTNVPVAPMHLSLSGNATIQSGGGIVMDRQGYAGGQGSGAGITVSGSDGVTGGGGGYGGAGGTSMGGAVGGATYGTLTAPNVVGSGGGGGSGSSPYNVGGAGGGAIQLTAAGTLALGGKISANGGPGVGEGSGGGSGGSVWLTAGAFTGSGTVSANGGAGESLFGGGGGGGRIAIFATTNQFTGGISAYGGAGFIAGGAGTIFSATNANAVGMIILDNGGSNGTNTPLAAPSGPVPDLTIANGAVAALSSPNLQVRNLLITSNGTLTVSYPSVVNFIANITGSATIQAGGVMLMDGKGYAGGSGSGVGGTVSSNGIQSGGGGGFGGYGGNSAFGAAGGTAYGSPTQQSGYGSGGGSGLGVSPNNLGGAGGGGIQLTVTGALALDGLVSANGNPGVGEGSGGGSGGNIWVTAGALTGGGVFSANGGSGNLPYGGGGGGGRIRVSCTTNRFTGGSLAHGGGGAVYGGAGTIYFQSTTNPVAQLVVDNGGASGANTLISSLSSQTDLTIASGAVAALNSSSIQLRNLLITSNSTLLVSYSLPVNLVANITGNAAIQAGGVIKMDGIGYVGGTGQGAGGTVSSNGILSGGGGGFGGYGGNSAFGAAGGIANGALTQQSGYGSGGGSGLGVSPNNLGGAGGGSIQLTVMGALALDGLVSANGNSGVGEGSGGGSGGNIWVTASALSGGGVFSANGGSGNLPYGGGGGGGRIRVSCTTNLFIGGCLAHGGAGAAYGGAGTIYFQTATNPVAQLVIDNGGASGANTLIPALPSQTDLTIANGAVAALTSSIQLRNLLISSSGTLLETYSSPANLVANMTGSATIQAGGVIAVDGKGYAGGSGTGVGGTISSNNILSGGGGGFGGYGGSSAFGAVGGTSYGSLTQQGDYGSGGGSGLGANPNNLGGAGGGSIQLTVMGALALDGLVSANGNPGVGEGSGGGSGGNIWVTAGALSGGGVFSANGGSGNLPYGGGGGGGRIWVSCTTNRFTGGSLAHGGAGAVHGGAGTMYFQTITNPVVQLSIDNGGASGASTPIASLSSQTDLTIANGAVATAAGSLSYIRNFVITSNSFLVQGSNSQQMVLSISGSATIQQGGAVVADGRGYVGGSGQGAGRTLSVNGAVTGGGGGYGGPGGVSSGGAAGGISYGSLMEPTLLGSGGGTGSGSYPYSLGGGGGGAIQMTVTGMLSLGGRISANGLPGVGQGSGGSSGGSILLTAGGLSGGGAITANGGSAQLPLGGGGGGGRIAVSASTNLFTGGMSAHGGAGFVAGGAGTIYANWRQFNSKYAQIVLDNGGLRGAPMLLPGLAASDLTISGGAVAIAPAGAQSLHNLLIGSNSFLIQTNAVPIQWALSGNATIQAGGGISVDGIANGSGLPVPLGAGSTGTDVISGQMVGGGGGYGGDGGGASGASGGGSYGAILQPVSLGSPGGAGTAIIGAGGGGAVELTVTGVLQLDGTISANGNSGTNGNAGGGSGGSIFLTVGGFSGAGVARANGGAGYLPRGGGGGGGRIAVYYFTNQFSGGLSAYGAPGFVGGGAGTVYTRLNGRNGSGQLVVDNGGLTGTNTPLSAPVAFGLTVAGGAVAQAGPGTSSLVLGSLLVESNASITHLSAAGNVNLSVLGNATVQSNASIFADGRGYTGANRGPGAGQTGTNDGSGAGYGGLGGASASGAPGGVTYGSSQQPANWGSAGGLPYGYDPNLSQGGGAILLGVTGTLTVNGKVTANGMPALFEGAGGGAGGSIWLTAATLAGNGVIAANGGAGEPTTGGGGGGGRIALYAATNTFGGVLTATGASGATPGQNGTLFVSNILPAPQIVSQTPSGVIVNGTNTVTLLFNSPLDPASVSSANLTVTTPGGPLASPSLAVSPTNFSQLDIAFPTQSASGDYVIQLGPQIQNLYGVAMAGPYSGTFSITAAAVPLSVALGPQSTNLNLLWSGASGVTYQIQSSTNLIDWQPYGGAITGSNGAINVALPMSTQSQLFFRLAPAN
jgi:hypothetical protein